MSVVPGKEHSHRHHRHDDDEHQARGLKQEITLLSGDISRRIEDDRFAAAKSQDQGRENEKGKATQLGTTGPRGQTAPR